MLPLTVTTPLTAGDVERLGFKHGADAPGLQGGQHHVGPLGLFEAGHELAAKELVLAWWAWWRSL